MMYTDDALKRNPKIRTALADIERAWKAGSLNSWAAEAENYNLPNGAINESPTALENMTITEHLKWLELKYLLATPAKLAATLSDHDRMQHVFTLLKPSAMPIVDIEDALEVGRLKHLHHASEAQKQVLRASFEKLLGVMAENISK